MYIIPPGVRTLLRRIEEVRLIHWALTSSWGRGGENGGLGRPQRVQICLNIAIPVGLNKIAELEQLREVPPAPIQTAVREEGKALRHVKKVRHANCKAVRNIRGWFAQAPQSTTNT